MSHVDDVQDRIRKYGKENKEIPASTWSGAAASTLKYIAFDETLNLSNDLRELIESLIGYAPLSAIKSAMAYENQIEALIRNR